MVEMAEDSTWTDVRLGRLHRLTQEGFEEFVMYLLRGLDLETDSGWWHEGSGD